MAQGSGVQGAGVAGYGAEAARAVAPTGVLRAAINFGNPVLARRKDGGAAEGVSVVLAGELARRLGVGLELVAFEQAGRVTDALRSDVYDICFLAVDPVRGAGIAFSAPYVVIEGVYAVREGSGFRGGEDVDVAGVRVGVVTGSAYDLYLTRALKAAALVRASSNEGAAAAFLAGQTEVLAGVREPVEAFAQGVAGVRVLPGRFMGIEQAVGVPRVRGALAAGVVERFVGEVVAEGLVGRALGR